MAVAERLVKVRLDHPIGRCMDLAAALRDRWGLGEAEVVPSDPDAPDLLAGVAGAAAALLERTLRAADPRVVALGTGRALKATVEATARMDCPQHRIVSLLGNMMADGQATPYNAVIRLADRVGARQYPSPLPVLARDAAEVRALHAQEAVRHILALCREADLTLVGIGQIGPLAPITVDGFMSPEEAEALRRAGAAGEITSWVYDRGGRPQRPRGLRAPRRAPARRRAPRGRRGRGRGQAGRPARRARRAARQRGGHHGGHGREAARGLSAPNVSRETFRDGPARPLDRPRLPGPP